MPETTCTIDGCDNRSVARGWCSKHYYRWKRHGDPNVVSAKGNSTESRFWAKVDVGHPLGCWGWTAAKDKGYGRFRIGSQTDGTRTMVAAHRWSYEQLIDEIPDGMTLDHLCRNPPCVNPDHLEVVSQAENTRRGVASDLLARRKAQQTHCAQGHRYDEENTYVDPRGWRKCRACARAYARRKKRESEAQE